jgi:dTDP-glucose pyrophosphorylase
MLARQLSALVAHGVERATVVAGPGNADAVRNLLDRCLGGHPLEVTIAVQQRPAGPGHALQTGLAYVSEDETLLLVLADTWFDDLPPLDRDWIGVRPAPFARRWCAVGVRDGDVVDSFEDRVVPTGQSPVAVGLYHLTRVDTLREIAGEVVAEPDRGELELSEMLGPYVKEHQTHVADIASWRDCGDLDGVLSARRAQFFSRSFNRLSLDTRGVLHKAGDSEAFRDEAAFLRGLGPSRQAFFPRVFSIADDLTSYQMEYLDLPTMSEVYLYRPAPDGWWAQTLRRVLAELSAHFWTADGDVSYPDLERRCHAMYVDKLWKRWRMVRHAHPAFRAAELLINGEAVPGGEWCVEWLAAELTGLAAHCVPAFVHGDLNFSNILHSPGTGIFRLVDPRGEFGGQAHTGDLRYDLAKLRHSYAGLYDAIVHGLYRLRVDDTAEISFHLGPDRRREAVQLDDVLAEVVPDRYAIRAIECSLFMSMLPLHGDDPRRQLALFTRGIQLIAELRTEVGSNVTAVIA